MTRLDRLARSTLHLCQIAEDLHYKGVHLQVLDQHLNTSDATGPLLFHMLEAIARFETALRAERQREEIEHAKARGMTFGRHTTLEPVQIAELQDRRRQGWTLSILIRSYRVSKATAYR